MSDPLNDDLDTFLAGAGAPAPEAPKEITWQDRLVLNNFFDTQPKKRAAYLEQLGFEMDPKDENRFRAIGSKGGYVGKIDPSPLDMASVYSKGGIKAVMGEHLKDLGDIGMDLGIPAAMGLAGAGTAIGGTAATANPIIGLVAGIGAGALTHATAESMKNAVADLYLEKSIPYDLKLGAAQALTAGVFKEGFRALSGVKQQIKLSSISEKVEAIKSAAQRFSGGKLTPDIMQEASKNPQMYAKEAVQNAEATLGKQYQEMFGIKSPGLNDLGEPLPIFKRVKDINSSSQFGKALDPLNKAADLEMTKLSQNPNASFKLSEILDSFQKVKSKIENTGFATPAEEAGLGIVDRFQKQAQTMAEKNLRAQGIKGEISAELLNEAPLDFSQARMLSKKMKDAAFDDKVHGAELLAQVAGSGDGQLGTKLTQKANAVGSSWNDIQRERHELLELANIAKEKLRPKTLENAFLGQDSLAKQEVQGVLQLMDQKFGTNYSEDVATANYQRAFKSLYNNPNKTFGFGSVGPEMAKAAVRGFGKGAAAGGGIGFTLGMPTTGAAIGGTMGALNEAGAVMSMAKQANPAQALAEKLQSQLSMDRSYNAMASGANQMSNYMSREAGIQAGKMTPEIYQSNDTQQSSSGGSMDLDADLDKFLQENGQ